MTANLPSERPLGDAEMPAVAMNRYRRSTDQRLEDMRMPVAPVQRCLDIGIHIYYQEPHL
jgi:hypothetical protein